MKVQLIAFLWLGKRGGPEGYLTNWPSAVWQAFSQVLIKFNVQSSPGGVGIIIHVVDGKIREDDWLRFPEQVPDSGCEHRSVWITEPWFYHTLWCYLCKQLGCPLPPCTGQCWLLIRHYCSCGTSSWASCPWYLSQSPNLEAQGCKCQSRFYLQSFLEGTSLSF